LVLLSYYPLSLSVSLSLSLSLSASKVQLINARVATAAMKTVFSSAFYL
jgi:hypothetical protein